MIGADDGDHADDYDGNDIDNRNGDGFDGDDVGVIDGNDAIDDSHDGVDDCNGDIKVVMTFVIIMCYFPHIAESSTLANESRFI